MTEPREVTVSDEEIDAFVAEKWRAQESGKSGYDAFRQALAAFLAARVPDAKLTPCNTDEARAHNALRAAVLRGPG